MILNIIRVRIVSSLAMLTDIICWRCSVRL